MKMANPSEKNTQYVQSRRKEIMPSFFRNRPDRQPFGFTLIELLIAFAIVGILGSIGYALYAGQIKSARTAVAIQDIKSISMKVIEYQVDKEKYPDSLSDLRLGTWNDPWGNPYQYIKINGVKGVGGMRKDRFLVPLNSDFDLFSMGPDGNSKPPLTAPVSKDDIIRANDGLYLGPAYAY